MEKIKPKEPHVIAYKMYQEPKKFNVKSKLPQYTISKLIWSWFFTFFMFLLILLVLFYKLGILQWNYIFVNVHISWIYILRVNHKFLGSNNNNNNIYNKKSFKMPSCQVIIIWVLFSFTNCFVYFTLVFLVYSFVG